MLLCPLENTALLNSEIWVQKKPYITQQFGENQKIYLPYGTNGHPGVDFRASVGTPIYASCDGVVEVQDQGQKSYGLSVRIRCAHGLREVICGHLSSCAVQTGQTVNMGQFIGLSGGAVGDLHSGMSTAPHLHFGLRFLLKGDDADIFKWTVKDYDNGYLGWVDPENTMICFKGGLNTTTIKS